MRAVRCSAPADQSSIAKQLTIPLDDGTAMPALIQELPVPEVLWELVRKAQRGDAGG
jgi:hypothetical protein